MKKHISFGGLAYHPTDHETHEGDCALSVNLIHEDEALRPIAMTMLHTGRTVNGRLVAVHQTERYTHLIVENAETYYWMDAEGDGQPTELLSGLHVNDFAMMGDTLCLCSDTETLHAFWQSGNARYLVVRHDDLLYDLTLTQNAPIRVEVSQTITPALARYLDAPDTALTSRNTLPGQVFPYFYDTEGTFATGATMVAAQMEVLLDQEVARRGIGCMKHIVIGMAALRLKDGSTVMHSNPFALWPADLTTTLTADRENGILQMSAFLHRHAITASLRKADSNAAQLIEGVEIFLSRPMNFLDMHKAAAHTKDGSGQTTSITFGHLDREAVMDVLRRMTLHHALTLSVNQLGTPVLLPMAANDEAADLRDLRRTTMGAQSAYGHGGRLNLCSTTTVLHNPMEIGIRYTYHTLDATARLGLDSGNREEVLRMELTAGSRADILDNADGQEAQLVIHAFTDDEEVREVWWKATVQYPVPGMMMFPSPHIREMEYHIRLSRGEGYRYYTLRHHLDTYSDKGMAATVYSATGQVHLTRRPAVLSLLFQQAEALDYDPGSGTYAPSYPIWQEESAADYEEQAARARDRWALSRDRSRLHTSAEGNPLIFPKTSTIRVGGGELLGIVSNTRRTADGLYGDGQYYAFTTEGVWLLRMSGGKWHAQQAVTRIAPLCNGQNLCGCDAQDLCECDALDVSECDAQDVRGYDAQDVCGYEAQIACTSDAVVYLSACGLMMLKGSKAICLSLPLHGAPPDTSRLPYFDEILATEPTLPPTIRGDMPCFMQKSGFMQNAKMFYDTCRDRICLWNAATDDGGGVRWPFMLVLSMRSGAWGMAYLPLRSVISCAAGIWGVSSAGELMRIGSHPHERQTVAFCSRPLALGERHGYKSMERLIVRGLFHHQGHCGSHIGVALWGSNDLHHWHFIASSADQYMHRRRSTPFKWFRLMAIGQLLPGESIEGASFVVQLPRAKRN